ncbi:transposase IS3/IS911 [Syntrophomonas wolfei subsp. wolfei str. Goettingen G311]|jgi:transposase-like protein|uniref:Transposase IS3/IS911 n=1 Tax=Syntrophomonas wolfei subsp. wolfei (strain DSM 2245B / Goettingen) TaxID=335541 RepID=Q0AU05_SYNWW|nr:transposase [Syntrophomonas wolfei]ABI69367.1 transposase IS3/IS911 [Syntrophomonas wolfei subsp. wolfei str. Goettingen G311]ABI69799.1 transposase IS3/IS911 [Syntrophomonas wolfei subsp. wolfei str. Goettingen G311]
MKKANKYSDELKEKIIRECQEIDNVAVVARRYEISPNTIHTWVKKYRERGTAKTLKKNGFKDINTMAEQLKKVSTENDQLKRLVAEKELELSILRELRDKTNPR